MAPVWLGIALAAIAASAAAQCVKESPPHAVALVELYTCRSPSMSTIGTTKFVEAVRTVNARRAAADIRLELESPSPLRMEIKAAFRSPRPSQAFLAFYENDLATEVKAGENEGAVLRHDYVVREWVGPIEVRGSAEVRKSLQLPADWKRHDLGVAAFVHDGADLLQATALAACVKG